MVYELEDTSKAKGLFEGWQEKLITSCLQKVMGRIFVTDLSEPVSAFAFVGCFSFFAGKPDLELVKSKNYFEEIIVSRASCTISSHCGPYTMGLIFMTK